jgi:hypothetical protein
MELSWKSTCFANSRGYALCGTLFSQVAGERKARKQVLLKGPAPLPMEGIVTDRLETTEAAGVRGDRGPMGEPTALGRERVDGAGSDARTSGGRRSGRQWSKFAWR